MADLAERLLAAIAELERAARDPYWLIEGPLDRNDIQQHCAAERRIVERHAACDGDMVDDRTDEDGVTWGHIEQVCGGCQQPWPCPDLRDLADGYGLDVEEPA